MDCNAMRNNTGGLGKRMSVVQLIAHCVHDKYEHPKGCTHNWPNMSNKLR